MSERPTVVITGAGGFAAPWVAREFRSAGYDVIGVDRRYIRASLDGEQENVRADLSDPAAVRCLMAQLPPSTLGIVHLAGFSHVGHSWTEQAAVFEANVTAAVNLFAAASATIPSARFLLISSAEIYGRVPQDSLPFDEHTPLVPHTPYGVSKVVAEQSLQALAAHGGMDLVIARPVNHLGPGQSPSFAVPAFAHRVVSLERGDIDHIPHGNLETRRDFLDVRDVARAYRSIFEHGESGQHYVVSSGRSHTMRSVLETLCLIAGVEPRLRADVNLFRSTDTPEVRGSSQRLERLAGWQPRIPLETTLADVLGEARSQLVTR